MSVLTCVYSRPTGATILAQGAQSKRPSLQPSLTGACSLKYVSAEGITVLGHVTVRDGGADDHSFENDVVLLPPLFATRRFTLRPQSAMLK